MNSFGQNIPKEENCRQSPPPDPQSRPARAQGRELQAAATSRSSTPDSSCQRGRFVINFGYLMPEGEIRNQLRAARARGGDLSSAPGSSCPRERSVSNFVPPMSSVWYGELHAPRACLVWKILMHLGKLMYLHAEEPLPVSPEPPSPVVEESFPPTQSVSGISVFKIVEHFASWCSTLQLEEC